LSKVTKIAISQIDKGHIFIKNINNNPPYKICYLKSKIVY